MSSVRRMPTSWDWPLWEASFSAPALGRVANVLGLRVKGLLLLVDIHQDPSSSTPRSLLSSLDSYIPLIQHQ